MKNSLLVFSLASLLMISILSFSYAEETKEITNPSVTQNDLKEMVENWMNNPDEDETNQRLEIMKAYYTFEETGQILTTDQEGLTLMNQIRKMVSLQLPKADLDQLRHQVRVELGLKTPYENKILYVDSKLVDCVGVGPQKCMQIREDENSNWMNFYDSIKGFEFVKGISYKISVKVTDVENPPADASSKKYELIEIIEEISSQSKHFPYMKACAPGFVPLGEICVLNDRCGPGAYPGKVCVIDGIEQPYLRPSQQGNAGIIASNVICAEGLSLVFKSHDGSPACVNPDSATKLENRGWQTKFPIIACTLEYSPICGGDGKTYGNNCMISSNHIAIKHVGECTDQIPTEFQFDENVLQHTSIPLEPDTEKGYSVLEIADGVYWLVSNGYQTMFLTTGHGVVAFDAPQPIGEKYIHAIDEVTDEPITHMIYSHHHQDHTGAAGQIFPDDIIYISHQDTADLLKSDNDPNRPIPTKTFDGDFYSMEIGNKTIEFYDIGEFHSKGNMLILLPQYKVAMLDDLFRPAESPYRAFGVTPDIDLYVEAHDKLQNHDFEVLISGHTKLLATKKHVETNKMFTLDVMQNALNAMDSGELNPTKVCSTITIDQWEGRLGNLDAFMEDHCNAMIEFMKSK